MTGFNLARYIINIYGPESEPAEEGSAYRWSQSDARVLADLPAVMESLETNLTAMLPEGYTIEIGTAEGF